MGIKARVGDFEETNKSNSFERILQKNPMLLINPPFKAICPKHMNAHGLTTAEGQVHEKDY